MNTFESEVALARYRRAWPWSLRPEIKGLLDKDWEIEGEVREIYLSSKGTKLVRINFYFLKARITYPSLIPLTFREWFNVRKFKKLLKKKEKIAGIMELGRALKKIEEVGK